MATIKNFLNTNGNKSLKELPFCEADILILGSLSYSAFINSSKYDKKMETSFVNFSVFNIKDEYKVLAKPFLTPGNDYLNFLEKFFNSTRYKDLKFGHITNVLCKKNDEQFFAMTFKLGNNKIIVYRGTDNTIVGWKEDFNMALKDIIPAQSSALKYLEKMMKKLKGDFIIAGHSKGGNLTYFAYFNAKKEIQDRVTKVYNLDGPGFKNDKFNYEEHLDKIIKIVPNEDVVGVLFDKSNRYKICTSSRIGILAHDMLSWNLDSSKKLIEVKETNHLTPFSYAFKDTINEWFYTYDETYVKEMCDFLFKFLDVNNRHTLGEIFKDFVFSGHAFVNQFTDINENQKKIVIKMIRDFLKLYMKNLLSNKDTKLEKIKILKTKEND